MGVRGACLLAAYALALLEPVAAQTSPTETESNDSNTNNTSNTSNTSNASNASNASLLSSSNTTTTVAATGPAPEPVCPGLWSEWGNCSEACGLGVHYRSFTVNTSAAESAGLTDLCAAFGGTSENRLCNLGNCSVDCDGDWLDWGRCNATCEGGSRQREYSVLTPAQHGGNESSCPAAHNETESAVCNTHNCSAQVNCTGEWGRWARCSDEEGGLLTCGGGNRTRRYMVIHYAANNGTNATCNATDGFEELQLCDAGPCPIDCNGSWGPWSNCSSNCSWGTVSREYTVSSAAMFGGADFTCEARNGSVDVQLCDTGQCPVLKGEPSPLPSAFSCFYVSRSAKL